MKKNILRFVCLLLCLMLLPLTSLADTAFDYAITFDMDSASYPAQDQEIMTGVADLLNILELNGSFGFFADNWLDINGDFILEKDESTRTTYHIWGPLTHWAVECSLLGQTKLVLNHESLLEFALKARSWLGLPLHRIALLVSPYSWSNGLKTLDYILYTMFGDERVTNLITAQYLRMEADFIAENLTSEVGFFNLVEALFIDNGLDDFVLNFFDDMPAWLDTFLDDVGLQITVDEDGHETWTTGDYVLYESIPTENGSTFTLDLPMTTLEWKLDADGYTAGDTTVIHLLLIDEFEDTEVDATLTVSGMPDTFPFNGTCKVDLSVSGYAFENEDTYSFEFICDDSQFVFNQYNGETGDKMLNVTMAMLPFTGDYVYYSANDVSEDAVDILSINDESLSVLVNEVKGCFMDAILPILVKLPSTSYQTVFSLLDEYGIIDILTSGSGSSWD